MIKREFINRMDWFMVAVACNRVGCDAVLPVTPCSRTKKVREQSTAHGWTVVVQNPESKHHSRTLDFCPDCTALRARDPHPCPRCPGGGLHEVFGHDPMGHRAARALHNEGIFTASEVTRLTRYDLLDVEGLGDKAADHIQNTLATPDIPFTVTTPACDDDGASEDSP